VSAMMMPRSSAYCLACKINQISVVQEVKLGTIAERKLYLLVNQQARLLNPTRNTLAHNLHRLVAGDVLVVLALLGFSRRRPDGLLQLLRLLEACGHGHAVHGAVLLVLGPRGASDVAAHDRLERHDGVAADLHAALLERGAGFGGDA
jgi:hypothetical protein